ncbi:DUF2938 domain-containing protein [Pseudoalteromonas luteoviolacea]|nr:DUF2938 domain-containing protein [Pseudoalteromonas luteoviolacea]
MLFSSHFNFFMSYAVAIGIGATLFMDLYSYTLKRVFQVHSLDYALVGRWVLYLDRQLRHDNIVQSPRMRHETTVGWVCHYIIGVVFSAIFLFWGQLMGGSAEGFATSVMFGLITVAFPFFIMQPSFGFGIAASKTPSPYVARLKSVTAHIMFGIGIYLSILILTSLGFEI